MKITRFTGVPALKRQLDRHPVYSAVRNIDDLRRQMKDMQDRLDRMSKEPKSEG